MIRAVLDTNVIISGLFWGGPPHTVFEVGLKEQFTTLVTTALIDELHRVLSRDKFAARLMERGFSVDAIVNNFRAVALLVEPAEIPQELVIVRDPKDRMVLACAAGGNADFIVSGDKDLLVLETFRDIPVLNAADFLPKLISASDE